MKAKLPALKPRPARNKDDNFDQLFSGGQRGFAEDPFDQLFDNVNKEKMKVPFNLRKDPLSFSSDLNSTNQSSNSDSCFGLFKSLHEHSAEVVKKKPVRSYRTKAAKTSKKESEDKENKESLVSETLLVELNFNAVSTVSSLVDLGQEKDVEPEKDKEHSPAGTNGTPVSRDSYLSMKSEKKNSICRPVKGTVSSPDLFFLTPGWY